MNHIQFIELQNFPDRLLGAREASLWESMAVLSNDP